VIFVDTGPLLARAAVRDQHHAVARAGFARLQSAGTRLLTSHFVVDEYATLLGRRAGNGFAAERIRALYLSPAVEILCSDRESELEALELFEKFADQQVSFTDCVSFALMRRRRVRRVFTYDRHFALAGFEVWPGP
jgi:predicted nucleic acid-binding protein